MYLLGISASFAIHKRFHKICANLRNYVIVKLKFEQRLSIGLKHSIKLNNLMPAFVVPLAMFRLKALTLSFPIGKQHICVAVTL